MVIKYTHPAATKYIANKLYLLEDVQKELSMDMIKALFTPIDSKWEDMGANKASTATASVEHKK